MRSTVAGEVPRLRRRLLSTALKGRTSLFCCPLSTTTLLRRSTKRKETRRPYACARFGGHSLYKLLRSSGLEAASEWVGVFRLDEPVVLIRAGEAGLASNGKSAPNIECAFPS